MRRRILGALTVPLAVFVGACGGSSLQDYQKQVKEAQTCSSGQSCVLAGGKSACTCAQPVVQSKAADIDRASEEVSCGGAQVECIAQTNLRCEMRVCVADTTWVTE